MARPKGEYSDKVHPFHTLVTPGSVPVFSEDFSVSPEEAWETPGDLLWEKLPASLRTEHWIMRGYKKPVWTPARRNDRSTNVNRLLWELFFNGDDPLPVSVYLRRECSMTGCVNPGHYGGPAKEAVEGQEVCRHGHDISNVKPSANGYKQCKVCQRNARRGRKLVHPITGERVWLTFEDTQHIHEVLKGLLDLEKVAEQHFSGENAPETYENESEEIEKTETEGFFEPENAESLFPTDEEE